VTEAVPDGRLLCPSAGPATTEHPPGTCLGSGCTECALPGDNLCSGCIIRYRTSPEARDRCECGRKLCGMFALERGTCFVCFSKELTNG